MATQVHAEKLDVEEITMDFDMLSRLAVGEGVSTAVVSASVWSGVDALPELMISGTPTIQNNVVSQKVVGGSPGVIYKISCSIRSSLNNILINEAMLAIKRSDASAPPAS